MSILSYGSVALSYEMPLDSYVSAVFSHEIGRAYCCFQGPLFVKLRFQAIEISRVEMHGRVDISVNTYNI